MILPARKLPHVETFKCDEGIKEKDKEYNTFMYDKITVFYYKEARGFFGIRAKEWEEVYKFRRTSQPHKTKEGWVTYTQTPDYQEMIQSLTTATSDLNRIISKENYDYFMSLAPERFV